MNEVEQLNLFATNEPAVLNGMYYERSTGLFVSYVKGRRHRSYAGSLPGQQSLERKNDEGVCYMNIYAEKGHKVVFLNKNGHEQQRIRAREKGLIEGRVYTVEQTEVSGWSTGVYLAEVPNYGFNSVMFADLVMHTNQTIFDQLNDLFDAAQEQGPESMTEHFKSMAYAIGAQMAVSGKPEHMPEFINMVITELGRGIQVGLQTAHGINNDFEVQVHSITKD
ncbi:hypothetical protein [Paenibacillus maysiensis]|uniref:hypothetical protein n=1 Tax=Paenibacillus maysiensis TaxID=1155954 RepID=UPI00046E6F25|nr:hypothetical protein [Paenibacillus maysiensis]